MLTLPNKKKAPDIFVIGGARCGSTSLHYYLDQHPDIHMCQPDKEPGYYCDTYGIKDPVEYASNFAGAKPGQLLGDASTPYLTCPASATLIHKANPQARIIIVLRQPADRAYSLYLKMCSQGHECAPQFETALMNESRVIEDPPEQRRVGYHQNYLYFNSGLYSVQLRRYLNLFPREQIHILLFEDLTSSPQTACGHITDWLGLPPMPQIDSEPRNRAVRPRSLQFQHWLTHSLYPRLKALRLPGSGTLIRRLQILNTDSKPVPRLKPELREQLTRQYAGDIDATAALINRDLGHWLKPPDSP